MHNTMGTYFGKVYTEGIYIQSIEKGCEGLVEPADTLSKLNELLHIGGKI